LGAGGLIAALSAAHDDVTVAFLTDGAGSHVGAPGWSRRRIAALRAQEASAALRKLGSTGGPISLNWRDADPFTAGSPEYARTVRRLLTLCRRRRIRQIVASWAGDPHCDHQAAAHLAVTVGRKLGITPRFYSVWGWTLPDLGSQLAGMRVTAMPVTRWRGHQRRALDQHRTQLGGRIFGATERFLLSRSMRRLVDTTHILLLEPRHAA
jgi:LmbE family N-acetylglucosaminyl deacetylase